MYEVFANSSVIHLVVIDNPIGLGGTVYTSASILCHIYVPNITKIKRFESLACNNGTLPDFGPSCTWTSGT